MPTLNIFRVKMRHIEGSQFFLVDIIFLSLQGLLAGHFDRGLTLDEYQRNRLYIESSSCYGERLDPSLNLVNAKVTSWVEPDKKTAQVGSLRRFFPTPIIFTSHYTRSWV